MRTTNILCVLLLTFGSLASAQVVTSSSSSNPASSTDATVVPRLVRFTGHLKDSARKPLTQVAGVTFALYKDDQGGIPLWIETQSVLPDAIGHYSVMLGSTKPDGLPADLSLTCELRSQSLHPSLTDGTR